MDGLVDMWLSGEEEVGRVYAIFKIGSFVTNVMQSTDSEVS